MWLSWQSYYRSHQSDGARSTRMKRGGSRRTSPSCRSYQRTVEAALSGFHFLQHLARLAVDEMNPSASGARHGFVNLAVGQIIGSPALHLLAGS
jgi:hypothetical protein